jgi:hypothetical protein
MSVPVNYKLNDYKSFTDNFYVPKFENRIMKLRSGAEDELTQIDSMSIIMPVSNKDKSKKETLSNNESGINNNKKDAEAHFAQIIDLKPSKQLSQPVEYPPIHIFVISLI